MESRMFYFNTRRKSSYSCHGLSLFLQKVEAYLTKEAMKNLSIGSSNVQQRAFTIVNLTLFYQQYLSTIQKENENIEVVKI